MSCFSFRRSQPVSVQTKYALGIISQTMDIDVCKWKACMSIYRVVIYFKLTLQFIFYLFLILEKHFDDPQSGSGYLAWRIKKVQRNTAAQSRSYSVALQLRDWAAALRWRSSTSTTYQDSPKRKREVLCIDKQLLGEHCHEAISFLKHSTDESAIKEKMRATFQYCQKLVQDQ